MTVSDNEREDFNAIPEKSLKREKRVKRRETEREGKNWGGVLEIPQTFIFNGIDEWRKLDGRVNKRR